MPLKQEVVQEPLLPHTGLVPGMPLFQWLQPSAIAELVGAYSSAISPLTNACGFVCADTYNIMKTPNDQMQHYCVMFRQRAHGLATCQASDYLGAALSVKLNSAVLYRCGGYVFDFTVPLRSKSKGIFGVFINGQARPDPPEITSVRSLCERYGWDQSLIDAYLEMPVLDSKRAERIVEFLEGDFVNLLQKYNSQAHFKDLDLDAFKADVHVLRELLERASRKPAWRIYQAVKKNEVLSNFLMVAPIVSNADEVSTSEGRQYCSFVLKHNDDFYSHLQGEALTNIDSDWLPSIGTSCDHTLQGKKRARDLISRNGRFEETLNLVLESLVGPSCSYEAMRTSEVCNFGKRFYELVEKRKKDDWLVSPICGSVTKAFLSVKGEGIKPQEIHIEALKELSDHAQNYLRRTELATTIMELFSPETDKGRRGIYAQRAKDQVNWFLKEHSCLVKEWLPLMDTLSKELASLKESDVMPQKYEEPFRRLVAPVLSSPDFDLGRAGYAECFLKCQPLSRPEDADVELADKMPEILGAGHLEEDLYNEIKPTLDWLQGLGE